MTFTQLQQVLLSGRMSGPKNLLLICRETQYPISVGLHILLQMKVIWTREQYWAETGHWQVCLSNTLLLDETPAMAEDIIWFLQQQHKATHLSAWPQREMWWANGNNMPKSRLIQEHLCKMLCTTKIAFGDAVFIVIFWTFEVNVAPKWQQSKAWSLTSWLFKHPGTFCSACFWAPNLTIHHHKKGQILKLMVECSNFLVTNFLVTKAMCKI